jgi:hypothetical protein
MAALASGLLARLTSYRAGVMADWARGVNRLRDLLTCIFPGLEASFEADRAVQAAGQQSVTLPGEAATAMLAKKLARQLLDIDREVKDTGKLIASWFRDHPQARIIESLPIENLLPAQARREQAPCPGPARPRQTPGRRPVDPAARQQDLEPQPPSRPRRSSLLQLDTVIETPFCLQSGEPFVDGPRGGVGVLDEHGEVGSGHVDHRDLVR